MAEFCKQCSKDLFGEDSLDLAWDRGKPLTDGHGWPAICEGCGFILVNDAGECVQCDLLAGKPGHGLKPLSST